MSNKNKPVYKIFGFPFKYLASKTKNKTKYNKQTNKTPHKTQGLPVFIVSLAL